MLIDAFTVVAQIINFMILLWFLRRYLYTPILKAIDEREKKIATQLKSAHEEKENSILERRELERKNAEFDQQKSSLMTEAAAEVQSEKQKLLEKTREEAGSLKAKLWNSIHDEYLSLKKDIYSKTQHEVFSIARKTLSDLADSELEDCIARSFARKISSIGKEEKGLLLSAIEASDGKILIRSTFSLSYELQKQIETSIATITESQSAITYQTSDNQALGIELVTSGYKLEWNISDYLDSMEKTISGTIEGKLKASEGIIQNAV